MEPDLAGRFTSALYFPDEAHMPAPAALEFMLAEVQRAGVEIVLGGTPPAEANDTIIDCRGLAARDALPNLRGVRGERLLIRSHEV